uniref:purine-nucleoside phosphorylase n=1 Tax=Panagrolaimus davidi TaxID=227884 RepID=A0A914QM74_9BILA
MFLIKGHKGNLLFGYIGDRYVLCMQGRFHPYEHNMNKSLCVFPIRLMHTLGVEIIILSNAAGGINRDFEVGDILINKDQIFMPAFKWI